MKKVKLFIMAAVLPVLAFTGCKSGKNILPNISGKAGEVLVVTDKVNWEGQVGSVLRDSLTQECPYLPQKEPLYSLTDIVPSHFEQMFQIHRNIIMVNISAGVNVPGIVYRYDKWAHPQIVITVNATSQEEAVKLLRDGMHTMIGAIEQAERDRVISNTRQYQEASLSKAVKEFTGGGSMVFPSGWSLKKRTDDFLWLSYETTYVQQGVFIWKYEATRNVKELGINALVQKRNDVLCVEVPGMVDGSYMTTSDIIAPSVKYASYKGFLFAEMRGFWDVHGDFMGGPFVSHTFYTPDARQLVCTEAYVYAPKFDKRLYLRQTEALLYSFAWEKKAGEEGKAE